MEIILLERIEKLGQMGDVVTVKDGYARNYLLPQRKALRATTENLERFERDRTQLETRDQERRKDAETHSAKLDGLSVVMLRQAADSAQLYGSVNARDVARAVREAGFDVERRHVLLPATIKTLGVYQVPVSLHPEVSVMVNVNVARSVEEAEMQAKAGEALAAEEAAPEAAGEVVEVERFFEEEARDEAAREIASATGDESEDKATPQGRPEDQAAESAPEEPEQSERRESGVDAATDKGDEEEKT